MRVPQLNRIRGSLRHSALVGCLALLIAATVDVSQAHGSDLPDRMTVVRARSVITGTGDVYSPGMIIIDQGKIRLVGTGLEIPKGARVIEARRDTVMAAFVHAQTRYQMPTFRRSGNLAAQSAADEIYFDEIEFDTFVQNGFVAAGYRPSGSGIPGRVAVVWTAEPSIGNPNGYLPIGFTNPARDRRSLSGILSSAKKAVAARKKAKSEYDAKVEAAKKKAEEAAKKAKEAAEKAKQPVKKAPEAKAPPAFKPPPVDPNVAVFMPFFDDDQKKDRPTLAFELGRASDLIHLDEVLEDYEAVQEHVVYQFRPSRFYTDFFQLAERLGERKAHVVLVPSIERMPYSVTQYNLASRLAEAGCRLSFLPRDTAAGFEGFRARVANLVRSGLDRDAALAAMTSHPAELLGLGDQMGTIEKEKAANLVFLSGDPLDPLSEVSRVMVSGKTVWERDE